MSDSPILRQADARDADLIAAMHADSWARTYRGLLPDGFLDQEVVQDRLVHWQHKIAGPEQGAQAIFIAELDGRPIGFVCVKDDPDSPWGVLLDNLHVLAPWQGTGAGKLLMRRALDWARARGARQIHLYALEGNTRAIAFYERQGWTLSGVEDDEIAGIRAREQRYVHPL